MGKRIAILCNGPSLADHPLNKIDCETMGLNRSWELQQSGRHVMLDPEQWEYFTRTTGKPLSELGHLYTSADGPGDTKLRMMDSRHPRFSFEPIKHGVFSGRCVTWVALQLARSLGYDTIYMVGLDLSTRTIRSRQGHKELIKFYPTAHSPESLKLGWARQRELFGYAAGLFTYLGIEVYNVNPKSECTAFPFRSFGECFGE